VEVQLFKASDATEQKFDDAFSPTFDLIAAALLNFYNDAFTAGPLGDLLFDTNRAPLANAIDKAIFRVVFNYLFETFLVAGTFESYLTVFQQIFGNDVDVAFTVPAAGKLNIDITAVNFEVYDLMERHITAGAYVLDNLITQDGLDNLAVQIMDGFQTQYEVEQMLFEMVPGGIFTTINLSIEV
jgi:hypothetical protein